MTSSSYVGKSISVTSSILHKQDLFWENILMTYETSIEELRQEEKQMYQYIFELKILIQAITTFNIIKLLNQGSSNNLINQLLQLKCICQKCVEKEHPIQVETIGFNLGCNDIKAMAKIKELIYCEKSLIDEVNILRIKDTALTQMKMNVDKLMKINFPNMVITTSAGTISDIPKQIMVLINKVSTLNNDLNNLQKQNNKAENNLHDVLPNECLQLCKKNHLIEDQTTEMSRQLANMLSKQDVHIMNGILKTNWCSHQELQKLVEAKQNEVNLLKLSLGSLNSLK